MQRLYWTALCLGGALTALSAQNLFTRINEGPVVSSPADSRSVNWVDVNNDGWEDLFISNGPSGGQNNFLYLNQGNGSFLAVTNDPIVQDNSPSDGATFADTDNDGDLDGFVVTWYDALNYYYRNNGNGSFSYLPDVPAPNLGTYSETAAWGDYDLDGYVDLFITNSEGNKRNLLYHNNGNGTFTRITTGAWLNETDLSRCVNWVDYDNDGDADLFITNENNQPNDLIRNDGNGLFTKITTGPLVQSQRGSMSASWGDVDNDGDQDVFVANAGYFQQQANQLFLNQGNDTFTEAAATPFLSDGGCSYGSAFADIDNDGDLDLAVANGFCGGTILNFIYLNDGQGHFSRLPDNNLATPCSFGLAFADYDHDGFLDLAIATCKNATDLPEPPNILLRNNGNANHWLKLKLEGTASNRAAIGAQIRLKTAQGWQMREISAQSGYNGQNSLIAHFGLGSSTVADSVLVRWPSGAQQVLTGLAANQQLYLLEEAGSAAPTLPLLSQTQLYPNPAHHELQLTGQLEASCPQLDLYLIDSLGRVLYHQQQTHQAQGSYQYTLNLKALHPTPGLYRLLLRANGQSQSLPLVIE